MKGKHDDRFSPLMCWKKNDQIDCTCTVKKNAEHNSQSNDVKKRLLFR